MPANLIERIFEIKTDNLVFARKILEEFLLTDDQLKKLDDFHQEVLSYSKKMNLTANLSEEDFYLKNLKDSLAIINFFDFKNQNKILDFGTGAGFPGIPLAIVYPKVTFYLNDSRKKICNWLRYIKKKLKLNNLIIINERIENTSFDFEFDVIVARAIAKTSIVLELAIKHLKIGGLFILYKGKNYHLEIKNMDDESLSKLGVKFLNIYSFELSSGVSRIFLFFEKVQKEKDLRNYQEFKKHPLF